jgi:hypothetical protein
VSQLSLRGSRRECALLQALRRAAAAGRLSSHAEAAILSARNQVIRQEPAEDGGGT